MRRLAFCLSIFALLITTTGLAAKGPTVRVTVTGGGLAEPVEVADPAALRPFNVWAGAGTYVNGAPQSTGFIVEWSRGPVALPDASLPRYDVTFYVRHERGEEAPAYVVSYVYDRARKQGHVYLPRSAANMQSIHRGVEGSWFAATSAWNAFIVPFLATGAATAARQPAFPRVAGADDRFGIYGRIRSVVLEPSVERPERMQVRLAIRT